MKQMVLMVINNPDYCMSLLEAWETAGAPGITIFESTGLVSIRQAQSGARDDLPLMPSLSNLFRGKEEHHRTMFTVVDDDAQAQAIIAATEQVFATFENEDRDESGVLFVLPVTSSTSFATARARAKMARG